MKSDQRNIVQFPEPLRLAENYIDRECRDSGCTTLKWHGGDWWRYRDGTYEIIEDAVLIGALYHHLDHVWHPHAKEKLGADGRVLIVKFKPTIQQVREVVHALRACEGVHASGKMPQWTGSVTGYPTGTSFIHCANGLLDLETSTLYPATPHYFSARTANVPYLPDIGIPARWNQFLWDIFEADIQSIALLQEWFGYTLTSDTRQQKMLLILGPKRSGKGTIASVLQSLIGDSLVAAPTLGSLTTHFGLSPLIGKTLAVISDARLSNRPDKAIVVERLLSISGEDLQTIDRKNREHVSLQLPTRFMMLTNELPNLGDSSGALASRYLVLHLTRSYFGNEDHGLRDALKSELPAIFLWALQGLERLRQSGRFLQPERSKEIIDELDALTSPIGEFLRECCEVSPGRSVSRERLYQRWLEWCKSVGRDKPGPDALFGRNLRSVLPNLTTTRIRDGENRERYYEGVGLR